MVFGITQSSMGQIGYNTYNLTQTYHSPVTCHLTKLTKTLRLLESVLLCMKGLSLKINKKTLLLTNFLSMDSTLVGKTLGSVKQVQR